MTKRQARKIGWFELSRGWYHIDAWEPHGPYEPVCHKTVSEIPDEPLEQPAERP
jgi:hypothetical protein